MLFILKYSVRALAIVSIASFVVGALMWEGSVLGRSAPGDLHVEPAVCRLGELAPHSVVPVIFTATNRSSRPVNVLGVSEGCSILGCVRAKNLPCVVPPHGSAEIAISFLTPKRLPEAGVAFEGEFALYSDCAEGKTISLCISGSILRNDAEN